MKSVKSKDSFLVCFISIIFIILGVIFVNVIIDYIFPPKKTITYKIDESFIKIEDGDFVVKEKIGDGNYRIREISIYNTTIKEIQNVSEAEVILNACNENSPYKDFPGYQCSGNIIKLTKDAINNMGIN